MSDETPTSWRFNEASWDMPEVLGWLVYRNPKNFSGLRDPGDVRRAIRYRKAGLIFRELLNALKLGTLEALRDGKKVPTDEWFLQGTLHHIIEQVRNSGAELRRADVLLRWPLSEAVQPAPEPDPSPNVDWRLHREKMLEDRSARVIAWMEDDRCQEAFALQGFEAFCKALHPASEPRAHVGEKQATPPALKRGRGRPSETREQIVQKMKKKYTPESLRVQKQQTLADEFGCCRETVEKARSEALSDASFVRNSA